MTRFPRVCCTPSSGTPWALSGTPAYLAPEQASGLIDEIDVTTDVFGLGGILYETLTGRAPYEGISFPAVLQKARIALIQHPDAVAPGTDLPAELCRITMKALSRLPLERHSSVELLRGEVEAFLHAGGWFPTMRFQEGELILKEGDRSDCAYIILDGQCMVFRSHAGQHRPLRTIGPGEVFGEVALFASVPRTANVAALTDVGVLVVTRESLEQELERSTWMRAFIRAAGERFIELDARDRQRTLTRRM